MSHRIIISSRIAIGVSGTVRALADNEQISDGETTIDLHVSHAPNHDQSHQTTVAYVDQLLLMLKKMEHAAEKHAPKRSGD